MPQQELSFKDLATDFLLGGVFGAFSKTFTAPIERLNSLIQTQNAIPRSESERCRATPASGIVSLAFTAISAAAFWRVNFTNCIRFFPTQVSNLFFKDSIKIMFPITPEAGFRHVFAVYMASCGLAAAGSFTIVYPLDYARKRLSSDVGSGTKPSSFVLRRRLLALRASFPFTLFSACPSEESSRTVASSSLPSTPSWASTRGSTTPACLLRLHVCDGTDSHHLGAGINNRVGRVFGILHAVFVNIPSFSTLRAWPSARRSPSCSSRQHLPTLRSTSPCASWAPPLSGVCA